MTGREDAFISLYGINSFSLLLSDLWVPPFFKKAYKPKKNTITVTLSTYEVVSFSPLTT